MRVQRRHQEVVRQRVDGHVVAAGHRPGGDHRVDDGLLGRLDGGVEQRIDARVGQRSQVLERRRPRRVVAGEYSVAGGEGEEQVAAAVLARTAGPGDAEAGTLGESPALVPQQRRIRGDHDDDGATAQRGG